MIVRIGAGRGAERATIVCRVALARWIKQIRPRRGSRIRSTARQRSERCRLPYASKLRRAVNVPGANVNIGGGAQRLLELRVRLSLRDQVL